MNPMNVCNLFILPIVGLKSPFIQQSTVCRNGYKGMVQGYFLENNGNSNNLFSQELLEYGEVDVSWADLMMEDVRSTFFLDLTHRGRVTSRADQDSAVSALLTLIS
uniref:Uncharacterized protein n=1 Tax=Cacopsylla melanoneura TaxID=428564 RepID=A0A8D8U0V9_9HEMI